jgi:hypothetical protein
LNNALGSPASCIIPAAISGDRYDPTLLRTSLTSKSYHAATELDLANVETMHLTCGNSPRAPHCWRSLTLDATLLVAQFSWTACPAGFNSKRCNRTAIIARPPFSSRHPNMHPQFTYVSPPTPLPEYQVISLRAPPLLLLAKPRGPFCNTHNAVDCRYGWGA